MLIIIVILLSVIAATLLLGPLATAEIIGTIVGYTIGIVGVLAALSISVVFLYETELIR